MSIFEAFILGLVQGLGEFLPISSSGHLIFVRAIMGIEGNYLLFDILLHVATLVAIAIVFWRDLIALFKPPFKTLGLLVLATIPAGIAGIVFKIAGMEFLESAKYVCFFFLISAILMFITELLAKRKGVARVEIQGLQEDEIDTLQTENDLNIAQNMSKNDEKTAQKTLKNSSKSVQKRSKNEQKVELKTALAMGFMQAVAIFPGITRSGSTIFGGIATGGERTKVARFSFFMSIPIILGATLLEVVGGGSTSASIPWESYVVGMLTAFLSGLLAIKFMLRLIAKANFKWFALYLVAISIVSFILFFV